MIKVLYSECRLITRSAIGLSVVRTRKTSQRHAYGIENIQTKILGHQAQGWCKHPAREDLPLLYKIALTLKLSKGICKSVSMVWLV